MQFKTSLSFQDKGVALVIVLAFVVLLTGLVVAYFSRTTSDRQISQGSLNNAKADELAKSALDLIVGDMKTEIARGTTITSSNISPQRSPKPSYATLPAITNLIRRSVRSDGITSPAVPSLASDVNSTGDVSLNGRSISLSRWNSHYMFPKANAGDNTSDPITTGFASPNFWSPDWVLVTRNGPTAVSSWAASLADSAAANTNFVIGRYAFGIYDEGGLLDANVVVLPSPTPSVTDIGRKGVPALADLTAMKYTAGGSVPSAASISKLVGWRNYATVKSTGTFPNLSPTPDPSPFMAYVLEPTRDFMTVAATVLSNNRTDQAFLNRKQLIEFVRSTGISFNILQFLGTFSRERNAPTYRPGSISLPQRFPLNRLALIKAPPASANEADIKKYFGLVWDGGMAGSSGVPATPGHWKYFGATGAGLQGAIPALTTDPDFFQVLNYAEFSIETADTTHIATTLALGAAIIDQYDDGTSADPVTTTTTTMIEYSGGWVVGAENVDPARSPTPSPAGMSPTPRPTITPYPMLNRPFRNVGELGYAYKGSGAQTIDFDTTTSTDGPILDLFTYNTAPIRAGTVNLNTANPAVIAALLKSTITSEPTGSPAGITAANNAAASPTPNPTSGVIGHATLGTLNNPAVGRADIARLVAATGTAMGSSDEQKETVARSLAEVTQTRTWVLFIDVIAQSGRYPPTAGALKDFVVEGEKRYWLHIAIDRITGEVVDQQLEAVQE